MANSEFYLKMRSQPEGCLLRSLLVLWLSVFFLLPTPAVAGNTAEDLERARNYFAQAQEARQALENQPEQERSQKDYEKVIRAFRRVYLTAPLYGNNTVCLMAIGELYQEVGRRWGQDKDFREAIKAYEFLHREYPHSRYRFEALLTIARIYRDGLQQPEEALGHYRKYLDQYPRSQLAKEAQEEAAAVEKALESRSRGEVEAASPGNARDGLAQVTNIRHWATPNYARVVIELEKDVEYGVGRLERPPRIYLDLYKTRVSKEVSSKTIPVEYEMLKSIRAGQNRQDVSRVVLDVGDITDYSVFELPNPYRLVIDLHSRSPETSPPEETVQAAKGDAEKGSGTQTAGPAAAAESQAPLDPEPVELAKATTGPILERVRPAKPNGNGAHSLTRALGLKIGRIILDPGHGGHDTGTIGTNGLQEKDLVLDVAKRLAQIITERLGSEVFLTRTDDTFVPLESRTAMANEKQADLFLSIHANASRSRSARGIETYYLNFTTDPEALEVAARENAVSQETISQLQGLVQKIALAEKVDESKEFAVRVQAALSQGIADGNQRSLDRGVKKAPFVVLIGANMPSVLTEFSFLSNPQDEKLLRTSEHRQKVAEALYVGIEGYVQTLSGVKVARGDNGRNDPGQ